MSAAILLFPQRDQDHNTAELESKPGESARDYALRMAAKALLWMDRGELSAATIFLSAASMAIHREAVGMSLYPGWSPDEIAKAQARRAKALRAHATRRRNKAAREGAAAEQAVRDAQALQAYAQALRDAEMGIAPPA